MFGGVYDRSHAHKIIHRSVKISRAGFIRSIPGLENLPGDYLPYPYRRQLHQYIKGIKNNGII
jgi:hypothetical protein